MDHAVTRSVRIYDGIDELSHAAASELIGRIQASAAPRFSIALSGGSTPQRLYELLARDHADHVPWDRVHLFWGDERYVPHDDPASNFAMVRTALLESIPIPPGNVHPVDTSRPTPEEAAENYAAELRNFFGTGCPRFDLLLLGMGDDGHTASLFPGDPHGTDDATVAVTTAPLPPHTRITLTMPVLRNARTTIFLVAGQGKQNVLTTIIEEPERAHRLYPAAMVEPVTDGEVIWMCERGACSPVC